jgi:hypothetical protein
MTRPKAHRVTSTWNQPKYPQLRKILRDQPICPSGSQTSGPVSASADPRNTHSQRDNTDNYPRIASWFDRHLTEWVQPQMLRAPEVILGADWDYKIDIWNLGLVVSLNPLCWRLIMV